jgi:hypothetical protein
MCRASSCLASKRSSSKICCGRGGWRCWVDCSGRGVCSVIAEQLEDLTPLLGQLETSSKVFR